MVDSIWRRRTERAADDMEKAAQIWPEYSTAKVLFIECLLLLKQKASPPVPSRPVPTLPTKVCLRVCAAAATAPLHGLTRLGALRLRGLCTPTRSRAAWGTDWTTKGTRGTVRAHSAALTCPSPGRLWHTQSVRIRILIMLSGY